VVINSDHLGTPILMTNATGTAIAQPAGYTPPAFPGQSKTLADLYYNRHRDYDPTTGRYIQADPIGLEGGASPYSYAMNNPLRYTDPTGEFVPIAIAGLCAGGGCEAGAVALGVSIGWWLYESNVHNPYNPMGGNACFFHGNRSNSGGRGTSVPKSGPRRDDYCYNRWSKEDSDCNNWSYLGSRAVAACKSRAAYRRNLCYRNSPTEPDVWDPILDWYGDEQYGPD
jgi:RHS repeat-associated protein